MSIAELRTELEKLRAQHARRRRELTLYHPSRSLLYWHGIEHTG